MKTYNIVIAGVGGQGSISLAYIIARAAFLQGYEVKTAELHGLAQRYGVVPCHVRFGEHVHSSVIMQGRANLLIGLEPLEALRACYYCSKDNKTAFVIDSKRIIPMSVPVCGESYPSMSTILKKLEDFGDKIFVVNASERARELTGSFVSANVYLLGYAFGKGLIPLEKNLILEGMKSVLPEKVIEVNKKVFEEGEKEGLYGKG